MQVTRLTFAALALALALAAGGASAQSASTDNAARCQQLSQDVQASFQTAVKARVPTTDPSSYNQNNYDIKGIMSQDVSSGFSKLMNLDFGSIINSVVNKGLQAATQRATSGFSNNINGILSNYGVSGVSLQGVTTSGVQGTFSPTLNGGTAANGLINSFAPNVNSNVSTQVKTTAGGVINKVLTPYGRPGGQP